MSFWMCLLIVICVVIGIELLAYLAAWLETDAPYWVKDLLVVVALVLIVAVVLFLLASEFEVIL